MLRSSALRIASGSSPLFTRQISSKTPFLSSQCARALPSITVPKTPTAWLQQRSNSTHAISNPTLANIEKRWEQMPHQEQADLWMALRDRMVVDWREMTYQEKKAAYYVAFGPHGPRKRNPPGFGWWVFGWTMVGVAVSIAIFIVMRMFARGPPSTMNKEWQEATNEYLKANNVEPITGVSSEGYKGKGMVQSPSKPKEK